MLIQAAQEAARSSSIIFLDGVAVMALISAGGLAIREYVKYRNTKRNGNSNGGIPGTAKVCRERGEKLAVLETKQTNVESDITEIKGDIKTLLSRIPPR